MRHKTNIQLSNQRRWSLRVGLHPPKMPQHTVRSIHINWTALLNKQCSCRSWDQCGTGSFSHLWGGDTTSYTSVCTTVTQSAASCKRQNIYRRHTVSSNSVSAFSCVYSHFYGKKTKSINSYKLIQSYQFTVLRDVQMTTSSGKELATEDAGYETQKTTTSLSTQWWAHFCKEITTSSHCWNKNWTAR